MNRLKQIIEFAIEKHDGQVDKGGNSYIFHPIAVAAGCGTESEKVVAFLHDVLEDTNASIEDPIALGVTDDELVAIQLLTKPDKEDYMHYNDILHHFKWWFPKLWR